MKRRISAVFFVFLVAAAGSYGEANHLRLRLLAGMDIIGKVSVAEKGSAAGGTMADSAYGFSPGLEAYWMFGKFIEAGLGFQWQIPREAFRDGKSVGAFNFVPIYAALRVNFTWLDAANLYFLAKLGYAVFADSPRFRQIVPISEGGPLVSETGGIFGAAALGISYRLAERSGWGLDLSMDVGYSYHGASARSTAGTLWVSLQSMTANFSLDWRF